MERFLQRTTDWVATRKPVLRSRSRYVMHFLAKPPTIPRAHQRHYRRALWRISRSLVHRRMGRATTAVLVGAMNVGTFAVLAALYYFMWDIEGMGRN